MKTKEFLLFLLIVIGCILLSNNTYSNEEGIPNFTGKITEIDIKDNTIKVQRKDIIRTFYFNEATQILKDKEKKVLSDLKLGLTISVIWRLEEDGKMVIDKIKIKTDR